MLAARHIDMLERPIDTIDEALLRTLIENQVAERRDLEFKRDLPTRNDEGVKEFLADVTSFANAQGGDLIYGIGEDNGTAVGLPGVASSDHDAEILRLESSLQTGVAPRLVGVRTHWVHLATGNGAIVMRIPASLNAPHRIVYKNSGRFYGRNSRGKYEMDVHELRHSFTQSEQLPKRFRQLHADAIAAAKGVNMPFRIHEGPTAVVSIIPLGLFRQERHIAISRDDAVAPVFSDGFSAIDTIEGVLVHGPVERNLGTIGSFALTHRTGRTDLSWSIGSGGQLKYVKEKKVVWPRVFEEGLSDATQSTKTRLRQFGIEGPWVVLVSVFGVRGYQLILSADDWSRPAFRDDALVGHRILERIDDAELVPIAETLWLLFGQRRPEGLTLAQAV